jgi:hypothetical protein
MRLAAIMKSQSYLQADEDIAFLGSDDMRGVRLQLDFMKVEQGLVDHEVKHTIVVFGSTRLPEPTAARARAEQGRINFPPNGFKPPASRGC